MAHSNCGSEPFSSVVVMVDCAGRLVVEAFYGSDQVVIDVVQPHGCPQSCMPNSVERLLEVHKDMVKALWTSSDLSRVAKDSPSNGYRRNCTTSVNISSQRRGHKGGKEPF